MSLRESRRKVEAREAAKREAAERQAAEIDAAICAKSERLVNIWNGRRHTLFYPTFGAALKSGHRWLTHFCPACQTVGEVDLAQFDYHPRASISALIPKLSCKRCCANPPFAQLVKLHREPTIGSLRRRHDRRA